MVLSIQANFRSLEEVSVQDVHDRLGVYVLWSGSARKAPSYIGEGDVLRRFSSHLRRPWARRPITGYIALLDNGTGLEQKWQAVFIEKALLDVARDIDRWPTHNRQEGKNGGMWSLAKRLGAQDETLRASIRGRDPFCPLGRSLITAPKLIDYTPSTGILWRHSWRKRH